MEKMLNINLSEPLNKEILFTNIDVDYHHIEQTASSLELAVLDLIYSRFEVDEDQDSFKGNAIKKAMEQLDCEQNENSVILFDCISRSIFLGDNFVKELEEIEKQMKPSKNLFGALTLGEIVNNGNEYITFYNKTCVIGVLC